MDTPTEILFKHWGYKDFRPLQEDVIQSVLSGKDTLALLPTGGGKSICYQVPGLMMEGICIVVSPLLALINDQVRSLRDKGIQAETVNSQVSRRDIDRILDNCIYGKVKFLFIAPERISSALFQERLRKMQVSLIAVDEAHCISQWGHDFRPAYRTISEIREIQQSPVLALTATATSHVVKDIQDQLLFKEKRVFRKSFARSNISFQVERCEDKRGNLLQLLKKAASGSGIIYVRNRRKCRELSMLLRSEGISSTFYHAGLDTQERKKAQEAWMKGSSQWVVATNAFGMGIDKADVRMVVHFDLSDSIESYYQEAGRAGRDGEASIAIQLFDQSDIEDSRRMILKSLPQVETVKKTYQVMSDRLGLAAGSAELDTFGLDIVTLAKQTKLGVLAVMGSLKCLAQNGYLQLQQGLTQPSTILMTAERRQLMDLQEAENDMGKLLHTIMRSRSGLYTAPVAIREEELARQSGLTVKTIEVLLQRAEQNGILEYKKRSGSSSVTYLTPRLSATDLRLDKRLMKEQHERTIGKLDGLIRYLINDLDCRMFQVTRYFGEKGTEPCGSCDVCKRLADSEEREEQVLFIRKLRAGLDKVQDLDVLKSELGLHDSFRAKAFRWCLDKGYVSKEDNMVTWTGPILAQEIIKDDLADALKS